jgi:predicted GNAT superfamily acetyltransferase
MQIRHVREEDYPRVMRVINEWWGGRQMADMLPKLFFLHFQETSYVAEQDGELVAFLVGFVSQTHPEEAYIHFIGVHPDDRKSGVAGALYERFFEKVKGLGCRRVRCVTSPVNKGSIAFHTRMGFAVVPGDAVVDGVEVKEDYDGLGHSRVLFVKELA